MSLTEAEDVVSYLEIDRYMGVWYEIATTPSFQQVSCYGTQAYYTFNETEGWVDVANRCQAGSLEGRDQEIQGRAELVDTETQAKLNVIFFNSPSPYWVVALDGAEGDDPYQWAVVSVPNRQSMWILSRTPQLSEMKRVELEVHLISRGFDVERLIDTPQP
jgi:apolipoprotein D and lipocalin family protein